MSNQSISKLEAARRQLETAISLYFDNRDSLSVHTLAYASFRVLFDIYPTMRSDGAIAKIEELIRPVGGKRFSEIANFLKHADRDPAELLEHHDAEGVVGTIGLSCCLYRRIAGQLTPIMRGFDCWTQAIHPEAFDWSANVDPETLELENEAIRTIRSMPIEDRLAMGKIVTDALIRLWETKSS